MPYLRSKYKSAQECPFHPDKAWRWIPGFREWYMVSTCGDIRRHAMNHRSGFVQHATPFLQMTWPGKNGYRLVQLNFEGRRKHFYVHRLVLLTFIGDPPTLYETAHLDGNRMNSHLTNLQWVTRSENAHHRHSHGTCHCGQQQVNLPVKLSATDIAEIRQAVAQGEYQYIVGERFGICQQYVSLLAHGKRRHHL